MILYSGDNCLHSHRVRLVMAEKGVSAQVHNVDAERKPEDLADLNPYNEVPTLVDRDLVLYDSRVIMEYLDERFPHPPLMPVDPVSRARNRLMLYRIDRDWYPLAAQLAGRETKASAAARQELRDGLTMLGPVLKQKPFFLSDELSLVDCAIAPLLWRLPSFGIELPGSAAKSVGEYAQRLFEREAFRQSLSPRESDLQF
ncbi:glutathione S-transferase N-terminal domain-containing protein [Ectothiorhodospiraceae bacterium 2226]|nr:glutathione S-transferase N-terminal domain-containing protein [Ectothiorhodospiraceae bacterium 2226]